MSGYIASMSARRTLTGAGSAATAVAMNPNVARPANSVFIAFSPELLPSSLVAKPHRAHPAPYNSRPHGQGIHPGRHRDPDLRALGIFGRVRAPRCGRGQT